MAQDPYRRFGAQQHLRNLYAFLYENPFQQAGRLVPEKTPRGKPFSQTNLPRHWHIPPSSSPMALRGSRHIIPSDEDQDMQENEQLAIGLTAPFRGEPSAVTTTSAGGMRKGVTETPISIQRSHYGLPETVTQVLTGTNYFTVGAINEGTIYQFRLTSLLDREISNAGNPTGGGTIQVGMWNKKFPHQESNVWPDTPAAFPNTYTDPLQWRAWFNKLYNYYHVMGMEYEITIANVNAGSNRGMTVASFIDTYGVNNSTQKHPTNASMRQMEQWPDVNWTLVPSAPTGVSITEACRTIKGYYYPQKVRQNVENDEDVSTWTETGMSPNLTELMTLKFFPAPFSDSSYCAAQVRVQMRFIVQYKDLDPVYRWPSTQSAFNLTAPTDILA